MDSSRSRTLLFVDTVSEYHYSREALEARPLGGTEATVVRIAEGLARTRHVMVCRGRRASADCSSSGQGGAEYSSLRRLDSLDDSIDVIVVLRDARPLSYLRRRFPSSRLLLWCHDLQTAEMSPWFLDTVLRAKATIVAVSEFHRQQFLHASVYLADLAREKQNLEVRRIFNPVDDDLVPDATQRDPNLLLFFSSPHKGLEETLELFGRLRQRDPALRLEIANPGYYTFDTALVEENPGVKVLGALQHGEIMRHVRKSYCVFYPNRVHPETFGLVYAESNAVGTPVLTHSFGAAPEILGPEQLVDATRPENVEVRFFEWRASAPPVVSLHPKFRLRSVLADWLKLLDGVPLSP
jgi:glycosyltransferase involved in cell wall biosynthesis